MDPYGTPAAPPNSPSSKDAADAVNAPSVLLLLNGAFGILLSLGSLLGAFGGASNEQMQQLAAMKPELAPLLTMMTGAVSVISAVVGIAASGFIIFSALKMRSVEHYGLAMASAIVSIVPCFGGCCCLGIPAGIWALVVLNKPEVKQAFPQR